MTTTGILMFKDMEELDFVGPWEVFTMGKLLKPEDRVIAIGLDASEVRCSKGMHMRPDLGLVDAPKLDVLIVPGGDGTRPLMHDARLIAWLQERAAQTPWTTSVCSGSLVLAQAGRVVVKSAGNEGATNRHVKASIPQKKGMIVRNPNNKRSGRESRHSTAETG